MSNANIDSIFTIFNNLDNELITTKQARQQILNLFNVITRLYVIKYYRKYAVYDQREVIINAKDEHDALTDFWNGKNKEMWEVESISLMNKQIKL